MSSTQYDTIVVGSGTSAYYTITTLNKAGQKVAVIDERPYGGTCALRGCQPKKYLVANAEAVAMSEHLIGTGLTQAAQTDWQALQQLKNEFLDGISEGEVEEFEEAGIATYHGSAQFVSPREIKVGEEVLTADAIVIATGAIPRHAQFEGNEFVKDSEYFLNMPELPKRILFVGGGYIAMEFAHVAARAGAEVTILNRSCQLLKQFDVEIVETILEATRDAGIEIVTEETPAKIQTSDDGFVVTGSTGETYETDLVIEATGRVPNLSVLEGGLGEVDSDLRGVTVNEFLQSISNPNVYAIGDVANSGAMLAPVADEEGKVAAYNILNETPKPVDYATVPSTVFTIPNLGSVGLTEAQAIEQGIPFRVNKGSTIGWPSSKRIGEKHASYKVLIHEEDNTIVGAHLARHNASEVINTFALAIAHGIKAKELAEFLWAYPTYTSDLKYMVR